VMLVGTLAQLRAADHISEIVVSGANLKPVALIQSLGVIFDSRLTFAAHVTAVCKACTYHIWALRHIHLLTHDIANNLTRCTNVVDNQAATSAELVGSCDAAATDTNLCGAPSAVTSPADLQAGPTTPAYLNSLISDHVTATRMSLRSSTRSLVAVPMTTTLCA